MPLFLEKSFNRGVMKCHYLKKKKKRIVFHCIFACMTHYKFHQETKN